MIAFGLFFAFAYLLAWWARCCFTALVALALLLSISAGYFLAVGAGLLVSFMMQLREPLELVLRLQVQENTKRMQLRPHATGHWVHCKKRSKEKTRCMIANPPRECLPLLFPCYPKKEKYGRGHVCRRLSSFSARRRAGTRCHDLQNAYRQWAMKHPGHCGMFLPASGGTCASARPPVSGTSTGLFGHFVDDFNDTRMGPESAHMPCLPRCPGRSSRSRAWCLAA